MDVDEPCSRRGNFSEPTRQATPNARSTRLVSAPDLSFSAVVVSFHTGPTLTLCLEALLNAPLCQQIVLVNNGNPPKIVDRLQELATQQSKVTLLDGHGNIGFGHACNLGAQAAREDALVFVNPDCVIDAGTLPAFARALAQNPSALLGGALRNEDGSEQRGCRRGELNLWSAFVSFVGLGKAGPEAGIWRDFNRNREPFPAKSEDIPVVSGALMAMTRADFKALGGFDPDFFLHVEDVDLCRRVRAGGGKVLFVPDASALHVGATSNTSSWSLARAKIASFSHYFWKHAPSLPRKISVILMMPLLALAIVLRHLLGAVRG
jgi:N-acetylglucosaminyl-diphospho-decaprenol L-rhamnosyltransferase